MKRLLLLPLVAVLLASCSQDIETNTPALQAVRSQSVTEQIETGVDGDGNPTTRDTTFIQKDLYRAINVRASYAENGNLIIRGETDLEVMTFNIANPNASAIRLFGGGRGNIAAFEDVDGNIYSTASSSPAAGGEFRLRINSNNTVTARFNFVALRNGARDTLTFSQGNIFQAPIITEEIEDEQPDEVADSFFARVNDIAFNPTIITEVQAGGNTVINGQTSTATITVSFPTDVAAGTYDLTAAGPYFAAYLINGASETAQTGTLNIVSNDTDNNIIQGEFTFDTGSGSVITDGAFIINY